MLRIACYVARCNTQHVLRFLTQQPDAVAATDAANRARRIAHADPADRPWGIRPAANAADQTRRIAGAHATHRPRRIRPTAHSAD
jgi:hypothetical protein